MALLLVPDSVAGASSIRPRRLPLDAALPGYELLPVAPLIQPRTGRMGGLPLLVPDRGKHAGGTWVVVTSDPSLVSINGCFLYEGVALLHEGDVIQVGDGPPLHFSLGQGTPSLESAHDRAATAKQVEHF